VGEAFDLYGYAPVFRWTAATALISTVFVLLEWMRVSSQERRAKADPPPTVDQAAEAAAR
jgi:PAT family beta-lactamase induction signal transducer AmpG